MAVQPLALNLWISARCRIAAAANFLSRTPPKDDKRWKFIVCLFSRVSRARIEFGGA